MFASISSCSTSCRVFPFRRDEGAGGGFTNEMAFGIGFETRVSTGSGVGAAIGESKNEKSADAHGS